eukprot:COSAG04_NODE_5671_length_1533_cov_23.359135_1_plen_302_part_10
MLIKDHFIEVLRSKMDHCTKVIIINNLINKNKPLYDLQSTANYIAAGVNHGMLFSGFGSFFSDEEVEDNLWTMRIVDQEMEEPDPIDGDAAATVIQSMFRDFRSRKITSSVLIDEDKDVIKEKASAELAAEEKASAELAAKDVNAAEKITNSVLAVEDKDVIKEKAAVTIQSMFRDMCARKAVAAEKAAAEKADAELKAKEKAAAEKADAKYTGVIVTALYAEDIEIKMNNGKWEAHSYPFKDITDSTKTKDKTKDKTKPGKVKTKPGKVKTKPGKVKKEKVGNSRYIGNENEKSRTKSKSS